MMRNYPAKLSWYTNDSMLCKQLAEIDGICSFEDIGLGAPILAIKNIFRKIYGDPELSQRLNDARGIFKDLSQKSLQNVDQKVSFDLSPARLRAILENDKELVNDLGEDFQKILSFYKNVQDKIIPRLIRLAEMAINGGSKMNIHQKMNFNYRLVDYYPDDLVGGLEVFSNGSWVPVPLNAGITFLWGWSAAIFSNGRIQAPLHRVVTTQQDGREILASRRNAAIFFVAPDLDVVLNPRVLSNEKLAFDFDTVKNLTVREFKEVMGKKWRHREGTLTTEEQAEMKGKASNAQTQDEEINAFLKNIKV